MLRLLLCGLLGCLLMGGSDWLMIYGDTAFTGELAWLTTGVANIPPQRNALALLLAFPAVLCYAPALFAVRHFMRDAAQQRTYSALTATGLTPWLCIHLFYVMILFLFAWLTGNGQDELAHAAGEALFHQFAWIIPLGEVIMLLPFLYFFYVTVQGSTLFPRWMALNNPLVFYVVLKALSALLPEVPFRLAFVNGLMSEAMLLWFIIWIIGMLRPSKTA